MSDEKKQSERLKSWLIAKFGSIKGAGIALGRSQNLFANHLRHDRLPPPHIMLRLQADFGLDLNYIMSGITTELVNEPLAPYFPTTESQSVDPKTAREWYTMNAHGRMPQWDNLDERVRMELEYLWREKELSSEELRLNFATQMSMLELGFQRKANQVLKETNFSID